MRTSLSALSRDAWRTRPLVPASVVLHATAAGVTAWHPAIWPWTIGLLAANHAVLTATGLWPRSTGLGPNWTRLPPGAAAGQVGITIDDGPDPQVTPRVLDILQASAAQATFFCIGERVRANPALSREIVARGHRMENHSQHHRHNFSLLGPRRMKLEIERAQDTISAVTGERPRFFRAPAGLRNPFLQPVLTELNMQLVSWTRRGFDTVTHDANAVHVRLAGRLTAGDILLLHDGNSARTRAGAPIILEVLPRLLDTIAGAGLRTVTLAAALP
jgi:peptidoglycan/xylan/chitin deacetylase (PgdA/CDA1 family)